MEIGDIAQFVSRGGRRGCGVAIVLCISTLGWQLIGRTSSGNSQFRGGFASVHARVSVSIEFGDMEAG